MNILNFKIEGGNFLLILFNYTGYDEVEFLVFLNIDLSIGIFS